MSKVIVVESKNDAIFVEAIVKELNYNVQVDPIIIDKYESLDGLSEKTLITALKELKADIVKRNIDKIGIVIDIDNYSEQGRLEWLDRCIKDVFEAETMSNTKRLIDISASSEFKAQLACYFMNVGGRGELETVLKAIKTQESIYADCLNSWKKCLEKHGKEMDIKSFDKFWVSIYLRYDTCSDREQQQAGKKCTMGAFDYVMKQKKKIWDFDNPILDDLKEFLKLFC